MNFYLKGIKGQSRGGLCRWARNISKFFYIYFRRIFVFIYFVLLESSGCQWMISQASPYSMCVISAMEYSSNRPEENAETHVVLKYYL